MTGASMTIGVIMERLPMAMVWVAIFGVVIGILLTVLIGFSYALAVLIQYLFGF